MDENVWRDYVKEDYNGAFVLWIDQSTDPLLAAHNSNGVCFAMALDFVTSYQMGQPGPGILVNDIRNAILVPPGNSRIPARYMDIQQATQAMFNQFRQNLIQLNTQLTQAAEEDKPALLVTIKKLMDDRIKQRFGPGMDNFIKFNEANDLAPTTIFQKMRDIATAKGPSYFLVSMRGSNGGHGIAFGFRPDLSASGNFQGIFEYFDANLGFFVFGTEQKLYDFFSVQVWTELYGLTDYSKFEIASFTAHRGRR